MDKTIAIRVDPVLHRLITLRRNESNLTLQAYITGLVINDLKESYPQLFENLPDNIIGDESINEAQKVVDFVRNVIATSHNN
jgi:hypothetical protein